MSRLRPISDPYRVLGVPPGAGQAQIKAAHRRLAKLHHPDAGATDEGRFVAVQEAYRLLSDPVRRREWDRQHGHGPVDARDRPQRTRSRSSASYWTREDTAGDRRGRQTRRASPRQGAPSGAGTSERRGPATSGSSRDPGASRYTWSAESVPWWEDFTPRHRSDGDGGRVSGAGGAGAARPAGTAGPGSGRASTASARPGMDFEVFNRSSGAAWSSAARRHFRRGEGDLPSRGAFRTRGSQIVTGAEARKLAAEEGAASRGRPDAEELFRRSAGTPAADRRAFDHDDDHGTTPSPIATPSPSTAAGSAPAQARAPAPARAPAQARADTRSRVTVEHVTLEQAVARERGIGDPPTPGTSRDPNPTSAGRPATRRTRAAGIGALGGAVAAGLPAAAAVSMNADGGPGLALVAIVVLASLAGAGAGYLLARGRATP